MSLSPAFLDALRARTTLSTLIGASLKIEKAGREYKACCPFHGEKTPSFTINDDKGFYHCFGCGAHGDAIRWLTDQRGMSFIEAVRDLADAAGLDVPAPTPQMAAREAAIANVHDVLGTAALWYQGQLQASVPGRELLIDRGVSIASIARFGLGLAPSRLSVAACGAGAGALQAADLLMDAGDGLRDRFRARIMIPIHDARGRCVGFGARATVAKQDVKYINSPASEHFDKRRLLFNMHRAAPAAREAKRLIVVEGYFDVIALDQVGIVEAVAPMGTALTEEQIARAWRTVHNPILLFDGDAAGRKAAVRACETALPGVGPGGTLSIAMMPEGIDPDDLAHRPEDEGGGRAGIEAVLAAAQPLDAFVWDAALQTPWAVTPEGKATLWRRLAGLASKIVDVETRAQYLAEWRRRFDAAFPPPPPGLSEEEMLPDGRLGASLSDQGPGVQVLLKRVAGAWLERWFERLPDEARTICPMARDIARRVAAGLIDEAAGRDVLQAAIDGCDELDQGDVDKAWDAGMRWGFDVSGMLLDMKCATFQRTDMGNAERWFARFGRDYLYTTAKGWLGWDGKRYRVLNQEKDVTPAEVMASVFETIRAIQREAGFVRDTGVDHVGMVVTEDSTLREKWHHRLHVETGSHEDGLDTVVDYKNGAAVLFSALVGKWGRASEGSGRIGCIPNLAKRWCTVELSAFDTDPMVLNCQNGTLHFLRADEDGPARVELRRHDRADMLTKITACDYDPGAELEEWRKFVLWAQPKAERRRYLQQWMGYNLTGDTGEQIFHIWWGPTAANGKSTFGNACRDAIGDYGDIINVETFLDEGGKKRGDAATPDLVRLPGVRFLTSGEVPVGAKINEALINTVTGGDGMNVRDNFRSFFRFFPIFKWTLWCNEMPSIPRGTEGIWRRVKVLLWESHLEPHERDRDLPGKLKKEFAGILAWMVEGLLDWMEHGFVEPEDVTTASADYKDDSDPLSSFLRLCALPEPEARAQSSHLYELFKAWAKATGGPDWSQRGFTSAMKAKGFTTKASNGMQWQGLRMVREVRDFLDEHGNVVTFGDGGGDPQAGQGGAPGDDPPPWPDDDHVPGWD
ncbi:DNA primase [Sphingobium sp. H39-3-25]|uniref:DNA primase n=1 Tax=Sphingobium arseniciresistens TaxID=3030834 RepID=UPI0023B96D91|nr:DNA primase [Sphingobium arseniciresistens]